MPVARLVVSESEELSILLSQCCSYCKGNECSIRLFIHPVIQTEAEADAETSLVMAD